MLPYRLPRSRQLEYDPLEGLVPTTINENFVGIGVKRHKAQLDLIGSGYYEAARFVVRTISVKSGSIQLPEFDLDNSIEVTNPTSNNSWMISVNTRILSILGMVYEIVCS
jgi:hypothetical protein